MATATKNPAAVALGRLGGQSKSASKVAAARANALKASKAAAARKNGQKGGWPKGKPRKARRRCRRQGNTVPCDVGGHTQ